MLAVSIKSNELNNMLIKRSFIFLSIILSVYGCDPADSRLQIVNDSESDIYFFYDCSNNLDNLNIFRNTVYPSLKSGDSLRVISSSFIKKNSSRHIPKRLGNDAWIYYVKNCPNHEINIYFFIDTTVNYYSDIQIRNQKLFIKHVSMSLEDLNQNNWTIKYP
jgi:hypothetical protein